MKSSSTITWRRRSLLWLLFLAIVGGTVLRGFSNARADPIRHSIELTPSSWAPGEPPVRIALLSDIHLGNRAMTGSKLSRIIEGVNAAKPDLVLIAGDFTNGHDSASSEKEVSELVNPLRELRAPLGVIAVLGNHDNWVAPDRIRVALSAAGITVLENKAIRLGPVAIVGVGDRFSGRDDVGKATESARQVGGFPVVLTHSPDLVPSLPSEFSLVLAGHTHCGQLVVPGYGALVTRSPKQKFRPLYDQRYRCGVVRDLGRVTIVTGGLGSGTIPIRLGTTPDWWIITLQTDQGDQLHQDSVVHEAA